VRYRKQYKRTREKSLSRLDPNAAPFLPAAVDYPSLPQVHSCINAELDSSYACALSRSTVLSPSSDNACKDQAGTLPGWTVLTRDKSTSTESNVTHDTNVDSSPSIREQEVLSRIRFVGSENVSNKLGSMWWSVARKHMEQSQVLLTMYLGYAIKRTEYIKITSSLMY
jgi:hypothetical protein